jgi:kumamolisin
MFALESRADGRQMVPLTDSVKEVPALASPTAGPNASTPTLVHRAISSAEWSAPMTIEIALRMRNLDELRVRISKGEIIPASVMAGRYYPLESDYQAAMAWIRGQGLTITARYDNHLSFFARGTVGQVRDALQVTFARVAYLGGEYTSAVSAPSVPQELFPALVGVNGLQQHLRLRPQHVRLQPDVTRNNGFPYYPGDLEAAYNAAGLAVTGAGETIGILSFAYPNSGDLGQFWQTCGISQTTASISEVAVGSGPDSTPSVQDLEEIALDVEWSSSLAPGALIRVYGTSSSDMTASHALQQVLADLPSQPQMHQVSMSYGVVENELSNGQIQADSQILAAIASQGVSVFFSSGDGGSRPDPATGEYDGSAAQPAVVYPASDPSVTGVGGTTLTYSGAGANGSFSETGWLSSLGGGVIVAGGGGESLSFSRPGWQTGEGVPDVPRRLIPDVSSSADPLWGAYAVVNGGGMALGGTSWSAPTWAGFCALLNQARIAAGLGPIGMLNPRIYPLVGSPCFQDITTGTNGDFRAGPGYDECTGIGTPNVGLLVQALSVPNPAAILPVITTEPRDQAGAAEPGIGAFFSVVATSLTPVSFQWEELDQGSTTWTLLSDGGSVSGSASENLQLSGITQGMADAQFRCVVTNSAGAVTSSAAELAFAPPANAFTLQPVGQVVDNGSTVVFTAAASGSLSYQWQYMGRNLMDDDVSQYGRVSGATGPQLVLTNVNYLSSGDYTCVVSNYGGSVTSQVAKLVVETSATPGTVGSLSSRAFVGTGDNILIGGFYVVGSTSRTVLVQAIGPALAVSPYNVSGTLQQPALSIHQNQNGKDVVLYTNTGWGSSSVLLNAAAAVYAQPVLQPGSPDSELLVTLPPGGYTAEVTGADGGTGVALVAIYELP